MPFKQQEPPAPVPVSQKEAEDFFAKCDINRDGTVTIQELQKTLCRSGIPSVRVAHMFADIDKDEDKKISKKEFIDDICGPSRSEAIKGVFKKIDKDKSGSMDLKEVIEGLLSYGFNDVEVLKEIFAKADLDRDGKIDLKEFEFAMQRKY